jgi:hypothetical protein
MSEEPQPQENPEPEENPKPSALDGLKGDEPAKAWYEETLGEDLRGDEKVASFVGKYKSLEDAIKGGAHAASKLGEKTDGLKRPGDDADPAEWSAFYNAIGRPEDPGAYQWEPPEGMEIDEAKIGDTKSALHGLGLTEAQFKGVMDMYASELGQMNESMAAQAEQAKQEAIQQTREKLAEEWGNKTNAKIDDAKRAAERFGISEWLDESGAIANPGVIRMLSMVEEGLGEDPVKASAAPVDPQERVAELKKHPAYKDKSHPEHRNILMELLQIDV